MRSSGEEERDKEISPGRAGKWFKQGKGEVEGGRKQLPTDLNHSKHRPRLGTQANAEAPRPSEEHR